MHERKIDSEILLFKVTNKWLESSKALSMAFTEQENFIIYKTLWILYNKITSMKAHFHS